MHTHSVLGVTVAVVLLNAPARADIEISKQPTRNMSCNAGVCTPTAPKPVLNVGDLTNMLASGDLTVQTGNGDDTTAGITVVNSFSWTNGSRLTLSAKHNIVVKAPVTVAGNGALTIAYAEGNPDGDLSFEKKGKIDFWDTNSSLIINGNSYTLAGDLNALAFDVSANSGGYYALANDYDAKSDGTYDRSPITTFVTGTFEGLGHAVSNLSIKANSTERFVGLFSQIYSGGIARDVRVLNANIEGPMYASTGALAGRAYENATILRASATGFVSGVGGTSVGGLVGAIVVNSMYREGNRLTVAAP